MKKITDEIIDSFNHQEYNKFRSFLLRNPNAAENRKDLLILEGIRNKEPLEEKNTNAFRQIKKRLKKQLEQFIILENLRYDKSSEISTQIDIAKYLFHKNLYAEAWDYLAKAQKAAEDAAEYKLLDQILDLQVSYSYNIAIPIANGTSVPDLLNKRLKNKILEVKESNTNAAYCELIYEIRKKLFQNLSIDVEQLKDNIFKKYNVEESHDTNNLSSYCNYVNIIQIILREEKDYKTLKEYGINCYNLLYSKKLLAHSSDEFVHSLLDNICMSAIRTKDYISYEQFIALYSAQTIKLQGGSHEKTYYDFMKYVDIADLYIVTNRLPEARESLLMAKKQYMTFTQSTRIFYVLRFYLMGLHFKSMEYAECIKIYQEVILYDEKKFLNELYFRLEYLLLADIYGVLFYYEDGDTYYALHLLNLLKRKYAAVLKSEASAREYFFIKILQRILKTPSYIKSENFQTDTEAFVLLKPFVPADWECISLNAWLVSKSTHRNYYDCYLDEVKP